MIIGIDPGKSGGVAILASDAFECMPMPDMAYLSDWLIDCIEQYPVRVILEKVSAMPGQGVTSMFTFGEQYGMIQGVLASVRAPFEMVRPQEWMRAIGLPLGIKEPPRARFARQAAIAARLYPGHSFLASDRCKVPHSGMVAAALIAHYGRLRYAMG